VELYEAVREQAHERRVSQNQFIVEGIREKVEKGKQLSVGRAE
jgi:predicted HicB family RNase H-like nuclease